MVMPLVSTTLVEDAGSLSRIYGGKWLGSIQFALDSMTALSMTLRSSRTLPGHEIQAEQLHCFISKRFNAAVMLVVELRNEMLGDQWNIVSSISQ
jgi:hypothetical protein